MDSLALCLSLPLDICPHSPTTALSELTGVCTGQVLSCVLPVNAVFLLQPWVTLAPPSPQASFFFLSTRIHREMYFEGGAWWHVFYPTMRPASLPAARVLRQAQMLILPTAVVNNDYTHDCM